MNTRRLERAVERVRRQARPGDKVAIRVWADQDEDTDLVRAAACIVRGDLALCVEPVEWVVDEDNGDDVDEMLATVEREARRLAAQ